MTKMIINTILSFFIFTTIAFAQTPDKMTYQAVVRDASNNLVTSTPVGVQISILQNSATGTAVYIETQSVTSNANGLVSMEIGSGTVVAGNFSTINWGNGTYFIKTEMDPNGGTTYSISGTSQLLTVPYAFHAKTADNITGTITETDPIYIAAPASGITAADITNWNNKIGTEADPIYSVAPASGITAADITNWNNKLSTETDPIYSVAPASGITAADITNWNNKLSTETDPIYSAAPASGITAADITNWNNKLSTETDPIYSAAPASGITAADITNWNNKLSVEEDTMLWKKNGNNIYFNTGRIGIGTNTPIAKFELLDTLGATNTIATNFDVEGGAINGTIFTNIRIRMTGTDGINRGIESVSDGTSAQDNQGLAGFASNANINRGTLGVATTANTTTNGFNQATLGYAYNSEFSNIALGGYANNGTTTDGTSYGVVSLATSTSTNGTNYGIYTEASNASTNYAGYFNGDVTVIGTFANPSDKKLKKDVTPLNNALNTLDKIEPVTYYYKKETDKTGLNLPTNLQYGFLAQDLETVLPELVTKQVLSHPTKSANVDANGNKITTNQLETFEFKGINYIGLVPVLVQGIKEQQTIITDLETKLNALEQRLEQLEQK